MLGRGIVAATVELQTRNPVESPQPGEGHNPVKQAVQ